MQRSLRLPLSIASAAALALASSTVQPVTAQEEDGIAADLGLMNNNKIRLASHTWNSKDKHFIKKKVDTRKYSNIPTIKIIAYPDTKTERHKIMPNLDVVTIHSHSERLRYFDRGAACYDDEDGNLSGTVEVSGQVVNLMQPGKYILYYNCSDFEGNSAQTRRRIVIVEDQIILLKKQRLKKAD